MTSNEIKTVRGRSLTGAVCSLTLGLMFALYGTESLAADYYIAKTGKDSNPGTLSQPWATINKANNSLDAGDTVHIRAGTYKETIDPTRSGQSGKPITFRTYANEKVTLTGASPESSVVVIRSNISYIVVDGLHLKQAVPGKNSDNVLIHGSRNIIRNCRIVNPANPVNQARNGISELGIVIAGGDRNLVEDNHIEGLSKQGIKLREGGRFNRIINNTVINHYGDAIRIDSHKGILQSTLIENNRLGGSLRSDGIQFNVDFNLPESQWPTDIGNRGTIIRNNRIFDNAENAIDLKGTSNIVIEGNYIYGNLGDNDGSVDDPPDRNSYAGAIQRGSNTSTRDVIIRNNIVFDNNNGIDLQPRYFVYNNNVLNNTRDYTGPNSTFTINKRPYFTNIHGHPNVEAAVKNNIIGESQEAEIFISAGARIDLDNNIYFNSSGKLLLGLNTGNGTWQALNFGAWRNSLATLSGIVGIDDRSRVTDPMFVNVPPRPVGTDDNLDFRLSANSPAVGTGAELTRTAGSGSGNRITLKEAGYFYDGFGVTSGDLIKVGSNDPVRITAVDYGINTVVVDRSISWGNNNPVHLAFDGSAPDIGAIAHSGAENPPTVALPEIPSPPSGLQLEIHVP